MDDLNIDIWYQIFDIPDQQIGHHEKQPMALAKQGTGNGFTVPLVEYSPTVALVLYLEIKTSMTIVKENLKMETFIDI